MEQIKNLNVIKRNKKKLDRTDLAILRLLIDDSMLSASNIGQKLRKQRIVMTERGIRKRIRSLQKSDVIKGFTIKIDDEVSGQKINRLILVKLRATTNFIKRLREYRKYLVESPYCVFAIKVRGDLDWIHYKCFPSKELADLEDDVFRANFGDMMEEYRSYDTEVIKHDFNNIIDSDSVQTYLRKFNKF